MILLLLVCSLVKAAIPDNGNSQIPSNRPPNAPSQSNGMQSGANAAFPPSNPAARPSTARPAPTAPSTANAQNPNSFHPADRDINKSASSNMNLGNSKLWSNGIDPTQIHNPDALKALNLDTGADALREFIDSSPQSKEVINKVLHNYGILTASKDLLTKDSILASLPSAAYLLKVVEEALALHAAFKAFLRKLLESVQQHLTRNSLLIADVVVNLERKYEQLNTTSENHSKAVYPSMQSHYAKDLLDLKNESLDKIEQFETLVAWKKEVEGNMQNIY